VRLVSVDPRTVIVPAIGDVCVKVAFSGAGDIAPEGGAAWLVATGAAKPGKGLVVRPMPMRAAAKMRATKRRRRIQISQLRASELLTGRPMPAPLYSAANCTGANALCL